MCVRGSGQHLARRKPIGDEGSLRGGGGTGLAVISIVCSGRRCLLLSACLITHSLSLLPLSLSLLCLPLLLFWSFLDDAGGEG